MKVFQIKEQAYDKIMHWVNKAVGEVSGLGIVTIEDGVARVNDVMLLDQENTGSSTDIDPIAVCKALTKFMQSGQDGDIKFWWHSHVDMGVFWSKTDQDTKEELTEHGWFLHTVFNKREETKSAFTENIKLFGDSTFYCDQDDIEMEIIENEEEELTEEDKVANEAYAAWQRQEKRLKTLNDQKTDEIDKVLTRFKDRIEKAKDKILFAKDEYEQFKDESLETKIEEWDAEFEEKCDDKVTPWSPSYDYSKDDTTIHDETDMLPDDVPETHIYEESDLEYMGIDVHNEREIQETGLKYFYDGSEKKFYQP